MQPRHPGAQGTLRLPPKRIQRVCANLLSMRQATCTCQPSGTCSLALACHFVPSRRPPAPITWDIWTSAWAVPAGHQERHQLPFGPRSLHLQARLAAARLMASRTPQPLDRLAGTTGESCTPRGWFSTPQLHFPLAGLLASCPWVWGLCSLLRERVGGHEGDSLGWGKGGW